MDYDLRILDPHDTSAASERTLREWIQAAEQGFHSPRAPDAILDVWISGLRQDDARVAGAWLPETAYGAGPRPVATFCSYTHTLNTGAELLPLHMITDITVSPAHRRQGLLRTMMVQDLAAATAPLAALTATEGSIYGRFGFGPATTRKRVEIDTTARFRLRGPGGVFADPGRCELVDPHESSALADGLFQRFHAKTRGSIQRPAAWEAYGTGRVSWEGNGGKDNALRGVVHLDSDGQPDAYCFYRVKDTERGEPKHVHATVLALDPTAELALWQFLASIDLTNVVHDSAHHPESLLPWALTNADVVRTTAVYDHIWLRVLDVPVALEGRPWFADDTLVLRVDDPLGQADGTFRVEASDGRARVSATADEADLTLSVENLSTLYLGGTRVDTLARAGRLTGSSQALDRFGRLMDGGPAPYSLTSF